MFWIQKGIVATRVMHALPKIINGTVFVGPGEYTTKAPSAGPEVVPIWAIQDAELRTVAEGK